MKLPFIKTAGLCFGIFIAANGFTFGQAVSYAGKTELGFRAGGIFFEGDSHINEDGVFGIGMGHYFNENWEVEAVFLGGQTEDEWVGAEKIEILLPMAELQYHFGFGRLRPYLGVGGGSLGLNRENLGRDTAHVAAIWGGGLKFLFSPSFAARLDARHIIDTETGVGTNDGLLTGGLSWLIGGTEREPEPIVRAPEDSDHDGVFDVEDECADTPAGVPVDTFGCPKDSDGDGVTDVVDACPDTPAGMDVDGTGCPPKEEPKEIHVVPTKEWVLRGVHFQAGSGKISPKSYFALDEVAAILKDNPTVTVEIQGHTDSQGGDELNQKLSDRRAEAVKDYLVGKGISGDRLQTKGFGPSVPVADNETKEGRARNRRIEFKVLSR